MSAKSPDGLKRGDPIPGSRLFRNFCARCGEAIRVEEARRDRTDEGCRDCYPDAPPPAHASLTPRQRACVSRTDS